MVLLLKSDQNCHEWLACCFFDTIMKCFLTVVKSCRKATIESVVESRIQLKYLQVRVLWQLPEHDNELIMYRTSDIRYMYLSFPDPPTYHFEKGHHTPAAMRDWPVGGPQIGRGEDAAGQPESIIDSLLPSFLHGVLQNLRVKFFTVHLQKFQFPGFWIIVDKLL